MNEPIQGEVVGEPVEVLASPAKARRRRLGTFVWILIWAAVALGLGWWWYNRAPPETRTLHRPDTATVVGIAQTTRGDMPVSLDALGTVTALSTVTVKTQISGKLLDVGYKEGQAVKKGDFLAQIDPRPYQAALEQAQGQLARDEAALAVSKVDLARYEKLMREDSIARQQVDAQRALVKQNEATVRSDKAAIENAILNVNYCRIVSPIDGRVGLRLVDPGNYVQAGDATGLLVIAQTKPISVVFALAQDTIPQFIKQYRSGATLQVEAYNRNNTQLLATGKLSTIDNQIDTSTGTIKLRAEFANEDETLFPNQFVNARLIVETLRDVVVAPAAAVQIGTPGAFVYLVNPNHTVSVRPVKVGPADGERVVILEGLTAGDTIVVDGVDRLRDGAKIKTPGSTGSGTGSASGDAGSAEPRQRPRDKN